MNGIFGIKADGIVQLLVAMLMFLFVLFLCYLTTKFLGNYQKSIMGKGNIEVIEAKRLSNNKLIEIVKIGNEYFVLGISKDNISMIGKVNPEDIKRNEVSSTNIGESFSQIFEKIKNRNMKSGKDE
jgi:flagellar protein FliO/FliZ